MKWLRFPRLLGVIAVVYLLGMTAVFASLSAQSASFDRTASQTTGTVVALVPRAPLGSTREPRADARRVSLAPEVTYTVDGQEHHYTAAHGRYRQKLVVGDRVTVLYAPDDAANARLRGEGRAVGPVITVAFAAGAIGVLVLLVGTRRWGPTTDRRAPAVPALSERSGRGGS